MNAIAPPKARPAAAITSAALGLLLIGVAVVAVRDLAVDRGWTNGDSWTGSLLRDADGLSANGGVVAVGIVLLVVGLLVVYLAVRPARRTHQPSSADSDVWVTDNALLGLATRAAEDTPGVAAARARNRRARIAVTVQSDRPGVESDVEANIRAAVNDLSTKDITVKTEKVPHDS